MEGNLVNAIVQGFERILRITYPGLLFWVMLPAAMPSDGQLPTSLELWVHFYIQVPPFAHVLLILTAGLVFYIVERYVIQEVVLAVVFTRILKMGAAYNYRKDTKPINKEGNYYWDSNGKLLWYRFGMRPSDPSWQSGAAAEERFSNYLASRMAWIHSLGGTWLVGLTMLLIGLFTPKSAIDAFTAGQWVISIIILIAFFASWLWHEAIVTRAEQFHYKRSDDINIKD